MDRTPTWVFYKEVSKSRYFVKTLMDRCFLKFKEPFSRAPMGAFGRMSRVMRNTTQLHVTTNQMKEYWGVLDVNVIFFQKKPVACIGISTPPPQKHHPSLSCQALPLLKSVKCPSPPPPPPYFLGNPPLYIGF